MLHYEGSNTAVATSVMFGARAKGRLRLYQFHSLCSIPRNVLYFLHQLYWGSDFQYLLLFIFLSFYYWGYFSIWTWRQLLNRFISFWRANKEITLISILWYKLSVATRSTGAKNRIFNKGNVKNKFTMWICNCHIVSYRDRIVKRTLN